MLKNIRNRKARAFTLTEILVVLAIMAVLATVVVLNVKGVFATGQGAACGTERVAIESAQSIYFAQNGGYASTIEELSAAELLKGTTDNFTLDATSGDVVAVAGGACA